MKKGETSITFAEFSDLWLTSNDESPLHVTRHDRRIVMYEASEKWLQDRKRFKYLTEELDDLDVCKAWFLFFKQINLGAWTPQHDPPNACKQRSMEHCMPKTHIFIRDFFSEDNWFSQYRGEIPLQSWMGLYETRNGVFRIEQARLHSLYQTFLRQKFRQSKPRQITTFFKEIIACGVTVSDKRQKLKKRNKKVVDVDPKIIQARLKVLYPTSDIEWECLINPVGFLLKFKQAEA